MTTLRSYAFAARFTAQSRVLLLARTYAPGIEQLLASEPWMLWIANGVDRANAASWRVAIDAVAAMPSASVDRIIWLSDEGCSDPADTQRCLRECSRILDRDGALLIRRPEARVDEEGTPQNFWRLVDNLYAEFPWVDVAAEVNWSATSITPIEEPEQGLGALEVDSRLAQEDQTKSLAYWCLCALRREDTKNWKHPTLLLEPQAEGSGDAAELRWGRIERSQQQCRDAAKLMTAQRRNAALRTRLDCLAQETQRWQQEEKPELLCRMVELQDRTLWLREQVVQLEQRSVATIEEKVRLQSALQARDAQCEAQALAIRELESRLEVLSCLAAEDTLLERQAEARAALGLPASVRRVASAPASPDSEPVAAQKPAARVQSLTQRLANIAPEDHRVLSLPPREGSDPKPASAEHWVQRMRAVRSRLGAQAPEFVTRPLSAAAHQVEERRRQNKDGEDS